MRVSTPIVAFAAIVEVFIARPAGSQALVPVGVQGQVNTYTINHQHAPAVGFDGDGNFVEVWTIDVSNGIDNTVAMIQGRTYN